MVVSFHSSKDVERSHTQLPTPQIGHRAPYVVVSRYTEET